MSVLSALSSVRGPLCAAAVGIALLIELLLAARLALLARVQANPIGLTRALEIDLSTSFYGLFVPGGNFSRASIRAYRLAYPQSDLIDSVATIMFDRLIATVALGAVGQFFWMLERPPHTMLVGLAFVATWAAPISLYAIALSSRREPDASDGRVGGWLSEQWTSARRCVRRFRDMQIRVLLAALVASVLVHLLNVVLYVALASSLEIEVSIVSMGWISTATTIFTMLPVSASGLGVREGALVVLLGSEGVSGGSAMALSILFFTLRYLFIGLLGGLIEAKGWLLRRGSDSAT